MSWHFQKSGPVSSKVKEKIDFVVLGKGSFETYRSEREQVIGLYADIIDPSLPKEMASTTADVLVLDVGILRDDEVNTLNWLPMINQEWKKPLVLFDCEHLPSLLSNKHKVDGTCAVNLYFDTWNGARPWTDVERETEFYKRMPGPVFQIEHNNKAYSPNQAGPGWPLIIDSYHYPHEGQVEAYYKRSKKQ